MSAPAADRTAHPLRQLRRQRLWLVVVAIATLATVVTLAVLVEGEVAADRLRITEVVTSNGSGITDEDGDFPDWVEIHNASSTSIDLDGYHLSDDPSDPSAWRFPALPVAPGERLVVFASGKDRAPAGGELHTDFRLARSGTAVLLTDPQGRTLDAVEVAELPRDAAYGRSADRADRWCFFATPRPGAPNDGTCFDDARLGAPELSATSGFYDEPLELAIEATQGDVEVVYTLDGSTPDLDRNPDATRVYDAPIVIDDRSEDPDALTGIQTSVAEQWPSIPPDGPVAKATVVRARAVGGRETAATFFVGEHHRRDDLPVVSLAADPDHLFDEQTGIYVPGETHQRFLEESGEQPPFDFGVPANWHQRGREWERPKADDLDRALWFEHCEVGGDCGFSQWVGVRIHGGATRDLPAKSLRLYARNDYGARELVHPFFGEDEQLRHRRLLLRNAGNDWPWKLLADGFQHRLVAHLSPETQEYEPAVLYLNGEYWGIHNLRQRYDRHYLSIEHGVDPDEVVIVGPDLEVEQGDPTAAEPYRELVERVATESPTSPETVARVEEQVDLDDLIDYVIVEVFGSNTDWPQSNIRMWRSAEGAAGTGDDDFARWRWLIYDLDRVGGDVETAEVSHDNLARVATPPESIEEGSWLPALLSGLLEEEGFRDRFLARFADHLNTTFAASRTVAELDALERRLEDEIDRHAHRWPQLGSRSQWHASVDELRGFLRSRPDVQREQLSDHFELDGWVSVATSVRGPGHVRVNHLDVHDATPGVDDAADWRGSYPVGVPVEVEAVAGEDAVFVGWEGRDAPAGDPSRVRLVPRRDVELRAVFEPA